MAQNDTEVVEPGLLSDTGVIDEEINTLFEPVIVDDRPEETQMQRAMRDHQVAEMCGVCKVYWVWCKC